MEPIRILHMIGSLNIGGSQTMVLNLYRAIDREKVQFDFVLDHPAERALAEQFELLGARIYTVPGFNGKNFFQIQKAWDQFFRNHSEHKVLHSHVRSYASVYLPIAKKHGVTTIIHSHATSNGNGATAIIKKVLQYPLRFQADWFFSCSKEAGEWLFGKRRANGTKHYIVKNAIDADKYRFRDDIRNQYRGILGMEGKRVYIHVGRFIPAKNHGFLLRVFRCVRDLQDNARLLLVGDGELHSAIQQQIETLGLEQDVFLLGNRQDIPELLQAADVFLFPSVHEGLGIVAVEAQAAGLPCYCSEGVPAMAKVTDKCHFLPLDEGVWVKAVVSADTDREDTYAQIEAAGYNIQSTVAWITDFYCNL